MIRALFIACVLLLAACASKAPLPVSVPELQLPMQLHIQRQQADQRQDWLLVIQQEASGLRWSLMDPLGIPLARQQLISGQWKADGLLPPNAEARELFAALLFALTPDSELRRNYPTAQRRGTQRIVDERWGVEYSSADTFRLVVLTGKDGRINYGISPLNSEAVQ
ncbi:DUF3261 domain-containing protein [Pseudomonas sp. Irchel 3A5]|uniref:DUF3261 domain-containing protein n=1 Tax=Pseudomonas sp. Irchel 3A5 TaxID=2008911 RepID=UPI000BA372EB|nr:DUF3261 domain-containing protein [Pseudomonas sp. Irchel 3A5]